MSRIGRNPPWTAVTILLVCLLLFLAAVFGVLFGGASSSTAQPTASEAPQQAEAQATPETPPPTATPTLSPSEIADLRNCAAMLTLAEAGLAESAGQILPTIQNPYLCVQVATPAARLAIPDPNQQAAAAPAETEAPPDPTPSGFELAEQYSRLGMPDKAYEAYATALAAAPGGPGEAEPSNLMWAIWKRLSTWFTFYQPITGIAATLLLLLIAGLALRTWGEASHYTLDIDKFTREGVKFTPEDFDPSNLLAAEIERGLGRLQATGKHNVLGLIDGPMTPIDLNIDLAPLPAQVGKVLTFLLKFIPKKQATLSGYLSFEPVSGTVLTVRLIREEPRAKGIHATRAFRQVDFEPDFKAAGATPSIDACLRLTQVATVWVFFEMYRLDHQGTSWREQEAEQVLQEKFGTISWRSAALNHLAAKDILAEKYDLARQNLNSLLANDPKHRAAIYNLIFLDYLELSKTAKLCDDAKFAELINKYCALLPRLKHLISLNPESCDPVQGNSDFLYGSIKLYEYIGAKNQSPAIREEIRHEAEKQLCRAFEIFGGKPPEACKKMEDPAESRQTPASDRERDLLSNLLSRVFKRPADGQAILAIPPFPDPNMVYVLPAAPVPDAVEFEKPADANQAMIQVGLLVALALQANTDQAVKVEIERLESDFRFSSLVRYNLACYYSHLAGETNFSFSQMEPAQALEKALNLLKTAIELDPGTAKFAQGDPQLHCLACGAKKAEFDKLINPPPASPPLSDPRDLIRQEWIERLAEQKIVSREDLLKQGDTYEKRRQLAAKLRIWTDDVTRLVGFADLLQIEGLKPELARLLSLGEYNRVERLKFDPPSVDQIRQALIEQNQRTKLVKDEVLDKANLTDKAIQGWLSKARDTKPRLLL